MTELHRVALIVFYDESNRVLLQDRRSISKRGEKWGYFGGHIESNETPEEAVVRETKEELGWDLKEYEFLGQINSERDGIRIERFVFVSPLGDKLEKFVLGEGDGWRLVSLGEADEIKFHSIPGDDLVLKALRKFTS